jgi:hypothetical protein
MSTLRELIDDQTRIWATCESYLPTCGHSALLRLENLVQRFGWDFDTVDGRQQLRRHLVCSKCGARWPGLIVSPYKAALEGPVATLEHESSVVSVEEATKRALARNKAYRDHNAAQPEPYEWHGKKKGKGRKFGRR